MKSSNKWARNIRAVARTVTGLVLAVAVVGMSITPVFADDRGDHGRKVDHHERRDDHGRRGHDVRGEYYPGSVYYTPPPVVYAPPPPPPGISIVFPIRIR